jgi:hypothetical protein
MIEPPITPLAVRENRHGEWWVYGASGPVHHAVARIYAGGEEMAQDVAALPLLMHLCQLVLDGASWPELVLAAHQARGATTGEP